MIFGVIEPKWDVFPHDGANKVQFLVLDLFKMDKWWRGSLLITEMTFK